MKWFGAIVIGFLTITLLIILTSSNKAITEDDLNEWCQFNYAMLVLPSGELVEGRLDYYIRGEDRMTLKVNGIWYSVDNLNVILIERKP